MTAALTAYLREFNFVSVALRLILAMLMGASFLATTRT
jgi:hypothetical protein